MSVLSFAAFADNAQECAGYNFTPDTPEFSNCLMQLDMADKQMAQQMDAQRRAAFMQMYRPFAIQPSTYNYQMPVQPQRQQTNCRWIGNVWNCQ